MSFRQITIMGHVGKDPEIRSVANGAQVGSFSVAVSEKFRGRDGEQRDKTTWFQVAAWQNGDNGIVSSVIGKYVRKGQQVLIQGVPEIEEYEKDGQKRYAFKVRLGGPGSTLRLCGTPKAGSDDRQQSSSQSSAPPSSGPSSDPFDDEIPF